MMINEIGMLSSSTSNNFDRYTRIIEMMKNSITSITARGKFYNYTDFTEIPVYSPLILTSNHKILEDSGFLRRVVAIYFAEIEKKSKEEQKIFNTYDLKVLGILGDFISQNISLYMLKSDWKVTALDLLKRFYEFAGFDRKTSMPSWLDFFEEQKDIEDEVGEKKFMGLRAFLVEEITRCYSLNNRYFHLIQIQTSIKICSMHLTFA